jgi:hypothetical protein
MGLVWVSEFTVNVSPNIITKIIIVMLMQSVLLEEVGTNLSNIILLASPHEKLNCSLFLNCYKREKISGC